MENITIEYRGDLVHGMPVRKFEFSGTRKNGMYRYIWVNMPEKFKEILSPNQYAIRCKTKLTDKELVRTVFDIYEAYAVDIEWNK